MRRGAFAVLSGALALMLSACAGAPSPVGEPSTSRAPCIAALPEHARAYFLGDSWTRGYGVADGHSFPWVMSELIGLRPQVDGEDGTGYVYSYNPDGRLFPARAMSVPADVSADLVILSGGINDQPKGDLSKETPAARSAIRSLRDRFPDAALLVVGPGPSGIPVPTSLTRVDEALHAAATAEAVTYVSPLEQGWFTDADVAKYIDPATQHLNDAGQVYFAGRLAVSVLRDECGPSNGVR